MIRAGSANIRFAASLFSPVLLFCAESSSRILLLMSLTQDLEFITDLARGAGRIVLQHYGNVERLTKTHIAASAEAVTEADRATQRHIVAGLRSRFPNDGIIGEENDAGDAITFECPNPMGRNWVIDPIDGTNNFIAGLGAFCVCIGLLEAGQPVLGVVYDVTRNQMYRAARGSGAFLDDRPIRALETPMDESTMLMLTSNLVTREGKCPAWATRWISQTAWKIRILGSAALEACTVAAGVAHGCVTLNGKIWDVAAPAAIVLEAGGVLTDLSGKPIFPFELKGYTGAKVPFVAAAPKAHAMLIEELNS
jgi:myo-inositol-1(or 4)-monophosphatase